MFVIDCHNRHSYNIPLSTESFYHFSPIVSQKFSVKACWNETSEFSPVRGVCSHIIKQLSTFCSGQLSTFCSGIHLEQG